MEELKLTGGQAGEVLLRLGTKGLYTWSIRLPVTDGSDSAKTITELVKINTLLQHTFPNHPEPSRSKTINW